MSETDDWVTGGIVPRRHHVNDGTELALRNVRMSCRMGGLPDLGFGPTHDAFGIELPDMKAFGALEDTVGDDECWGLWQFDPGALDSRGIPGWANAWPATYYNDNGPAGDSTGTGTSGSFGKGVWPVRDRGWGADKRFLRKDVSLHPAQQRLPNGFPGIVIAGTEEKSQQDLFFPTGNVLVAPWHDGAPELGSFVYDTNFSNDLDYDRRAHLQSALRVYKVGPTCGGNMYGADSRMRGLAIQMGIARGGFAGRAVFADSPQWIDVGALFPLGGGTQQKPGTGSGGKVSGTTGKSATANPPQTLAGGSWQVGGCLHVGAGPGDQHLQGVNDDGDTFGPLHYNPKAPWFNGTGRDAPFLFAIPLYNARKGFGSLTECELVYDPNTFHDTPCGPRRGYHRWQVPTFMDVPPPNDGPPPPPPTSTGGGSPPPGGPPPGGPGGPPPGGPGGGPGGGGPPGSPPPGGPGGGAGGAAGSIADGPGGPLTTPGTQVIPTPGSTPGRGERRVVVGPLVPITRNKLTARQLGGLNLPVLGFLNEIAAPALVFRPQHQQKGFPDYRYSTGWGPDDATRVRQSTPASLRFESIGNQSAAGSWVRTKVPTQGRYRGGTQNGGGWYLPPEIGLEHVYDGQEPASWSTTHVGFYKVSTAWAKPGFGGAPLLGFGISRNSFGTQLTVDYYNGSGVKAPTPPFVLAQDSLTGLLYGQQILTGTPGSSNLPKGFVSGLALVQNPASTTQVTVKAGSCRDSSNGSDLVVSADIANVQLGGPNGAAATDQKTATGTGTVAVTSPTCTMTQSLIPDLVSRNGTGNIAVDASGNVTGTAGTKFLSEIAVGDVIGNATNGWGQVVSITSDTVAKLVSALPGGALAASAFTVFENLCFAAGAIGSAHVKTITADGLTVVGDRNLNNGVAGAGLAVTIGAITPSTLGANGVATFYYMWLRASTTGGSPTAAWSTQRTTPYPIANYSSVSVRRIGSVVVDNSAAIVPFSQRGSGQEREYQFEIAVAAATITNRVVSQQGATAWTGVACSTICPPSAHTIALLIQCYRPAVINNIYVRGRGQGAGATSRPTLAGAQGPSDQGGTYARVMCDSAQGIDWVLSAADANNPGFIDVIGYVETIA